MAAWEDAWEDVFITCSGSRRARVADHKVLGGAFRSTHPQGGLGECLRRHQVLDFNVHVLLLQ